MSNDSYLGVIVVKTRQGYLVTAANNISAVLKYEDCVLPQFVSDDCKHDYYSVGDFITVAFKSDKDSKCQSLSLYPSMINNEITSHSLPLKNQAIVVAVISKEENGFFASYTDNPDDSDYRVFIKTTDDSIFVGLCITVYVDSVRKDKKLIVCTTQRERYLSYSSLCDVTQLIAGQLVEAKLLNVNYQVDQVVDAFGIPRKKAIKSEQKTKYSKYFNSKVSNVELLFCSTVEGLVNYQHIHNPMITFDESTDTSLQSLNFPYTEQIGEPHYPSYYPLLDRFKDNLFLARLISKTENSNKLKFVFSILPNIVLLRTPECLLQCNTYTSSFGCKKKICTLIAQSHEKGAFFFLKDDEKQHFVYVNKNKIDNIKQTTILSNDAIGTEHEVRVLHSNLMNGAIYGSLLDQHFKKTILNAADCHIGMDLMVTVLSSGQTHVLVKVSDSLKGIIPIQHISDIPNSKIVATKFKIGNQVNCKVVEINYAENKLYLTCKPTLVNMSQDEISRYCKDLDVNESYVFVVQKYSSSGLVCTGFNGVKIFIPYIDIAKNGLNLANVEHAEAEKLVKKSKSYQPGCLLTVRVISVSHDAFDSTKQFCKGSLNLTYDANVFKSKLQQISLDLTRSTTDLVNDILQVVPLNSQLTGTISHESSVECYYYVKLSQAVSAELHYLLSQETLTDSSNLSGLYAKNNSVNVTVISGALKPSAQNKIFLAVCSSALDDKSILERTRNVSMLKRGDVLTGVVKYSSGKGILVDITTNVTAQLRFENITGYGFDERVASSSKRRIDEASVRELFPRGMVLQKCTVAEINSELNRVSITLKPLSEYKNCNEINWNNIAVGQNLPGKVKGVHDFGILIRLDNSSNIDVLCRKKDIYDSDDDTDDSNKPTKPTYEPGNDVLVKVLLVDRKNKKVCVGLKPSLFTDLCESDCDAACDDVSNTTVMTCDSMTANDAESCTVDSDLSDDEVDDFKSLSDDECVDVDNNSTNMTDVSRLPRVNILDANSKAKSLAQGDIEMNEESLHRLVMIESDKALAWIYLMSYYVEQKQFDNVISVAHEALAKIPMEDVPECMAIWKALVNAIANSDENDLYVYDVINEAIRYSSSIDLIEHIINMCIAVKRFNVIHIMSPLILKKQRNYKVWLVLLKALLTEQSENYVEKCESIIKRSASVLLPAEVTFLRILFARHFYKIGLKERGRAEFMKLLQDYPKRTDLWNVLFDLEIANSKNRKDYSVVRSLFLQASNAPLKSSKLKCILQRWLEFESAHGSAQDIVDCKSVIAKHYGDS